MLVCIGGMPDRPNRAIVRVVFRIFQDALHFDPFQELAFTMWRPCICQEAGSKFVMIRSFAECASDIGNAVENPFTSDETADNLRSHRDTAACVNHRNNRNLFRFRRRIFPHARRFRLRCRFRFRLNRRFRFWLRCRFRLRCRNNIAGIAKIDGSGIRCNGDGKSSHGGDSHKKKSFEFGKPPLYQPHGTTRNGLSKPETQMIILTHAAGTADYRG